MTKYFIKAGARRGSILASYRGDFSSYEAAVEAAIEFREIWKADHWWVQRVAGDAPRTPDDPSRLEATAMGATGEVEPAT